MHKDANAQAVLSDIPAFRLFENIYFVGSTKVSVHVIDTEEGLVMIDTGYPVMQQQILHSLAALGLDPKRICAILHSHGHYDHVGNTQFFAAQGGARTYISRADNEIVNGTLDLSWARELGEEPLPFFNCDILVEDGDVFTFGSTRVRCLLTPGHTDGVLSFLITLPSGTVAAMHGGIGRNSMAAKFLQSYGLSLDCRERFREGLHRLADEHVDLVLGNHPQQNDTEGKRLAVLQGHSPLDAAEWQRFLANAEKKLDEMLKKETSEH